MKLLLFVAALRVPVAAARRLRPLHEVRDPRWLKTEKEKNMKLLTAYELSRYSKLELRIIFCEASRQLARTEPDTIERAKALATLENISRALCR